MLGEDSSNNNYSSSNKHKALNLFNLKIFDNAIIEEASQIPEPIGIAPLYIAQSVCMVGDHLQMSPITKSESSHLKISLFERLLHIRSNNHLGEYINYSILSYQYRMNQGIMDVSNHLT